MRKQSWICAAALLMELFVLRIGVAQAKITQDTAQKLMAEDSTMNHFGYSVSVDADTALIGAPRDDDQGEYTGSAYVFIRSETGQWIQQAKLTASDAAAGANFGSSVSLSGETVLIGSEGSAAYIFIRTQDGLGYRRNSSLLKE